ncbi:MAG TPA: ATP-binding protein [Pyrinomonadaceae bacterium]|nr:ATP-binding protein [Pyrinomonadaceae bacterium]
MPRVLLVDDEPSIRLTMAEFLRRDGYEVAVAADFQSGVALAADWRAGDADGGLDAAVVDINLPGRSGLDLLRELGGPEGAVPVVVITGEPNPALIPEIVRAGAYDFIAKPVVKEVLLKAVGRAVGHKRLSDEKRRLEDEVRRHAETLERRVEERTAELIEAYRVLAHQEKVAALGRAAAQVAHEVKNPLAGLLLYATHLRGKTAGRLAEGEAALLDKIVATINHLSSTCEQVLNFARPPRVEPRPLDLNRVVSDVLQLAAPQLDAARVELRREFDAGGVVAPLDEPAASSALMNLVLNAAQAMRGGGTLTVRTGAGGGAAFVEVADTGCGMTEEQVRNVFEPFYSTKPSGLGLGMPYARKVVEQHGGRIRIESRPGEGTTVRVDLPAEGTR